MAASSIPANTIRQTHRILLFYPKFRYRIPMPPARHAASLAVPFLQITDIDASLRFYCEGLGFVLTKHWSPEGRIRWCWLELDRVALMLQESKPPSPRGVGLSICISCVDAVAIDRDLQRRGVVAERPFVGNGLWVTGLADPDGYRIEFESPTPDLEGTVLEDLPPNQ
jgi:catechol 2,3-dioxygenase-like lactoylglutathione lyase family enzyme